MGSPRTNTELNLDHRKGGKRSFGYTPMPYSAMHKQIEEGGELSAAPVKTLGVTWNLYINRARLRGLTKKMASAKP